MSWICCQIGAREHYAVPRALYRRRALDQLVTDAWVPASSILRIFSGQRSMVSGRWHQELSDAPVRAFTASLLIFELLARARGLAGWEKVIARNNWFQKQVVKTLQDYETTDYGTTGRPLTLFSYSYAALEPLRFAKSRGWKTVLGQIDPGPLEERIVAEEVARVPGLARNWKPAPPLYWDSWREECKLADRIIVNSEWARAALVESGVIGEKLSVIPLAYEGEGPQDYGTTRLQERKYPARFTRDRPLRVLFLGQVNLRKGVARLLNAIRLLGAEPIEFQFVGPVQISVPDDLTNNPRVRWLSTVSRGEVDTFYRDADVLIFPTLSDGFGLTQLEAQAWSLPVIASRFCGEVVADRQNGLRLQEVCPEAIAEALRYCVQRPEHLRAWSENSVKPEKFGLNTLAGQLMSLSEATS
jgi:glycosyltransferase involved in cell wall biosynthesis